MHDDVTSLLQYDLLMLMLPLFLVAGVILLIKWRQYTKDVQLRQVEYQKRLLDKFEGAEEFIKFAQTEEGRKLLAGGTPEQKPGARNLLRQIQIGVVLCAAGAGFIVFGGRVSDAERILGRAEDLAGWGIILVCVGGALMISAAIIFALARKWNVFDSQ